MKRLLSLAIAITVVGAASVAQAAGPSIFRLASNQKIAPGAPGFMIAQGTVPTAIFAPPPAPAADGAVPTPEPAGGPVASAAPVASYGGGCCCPNVRYSDLKNIAPCAVPKMIWIVDPCWKPAKCGCCRPAKPPCIQVKICVPPCGCPCIKVSKDGRKIKYDYGKYEVEITSKNGRVRVDYDD